MQSVSDLHPFVDRFSGLGPQEDAACWVHGATQHSPEESQAKIARIRTYS